jgi:hypothetical protein
VVFKIKQYQVACQEDINDKSNVRTDITHRCSCCSGFSFGLFDNRRLGWCSDIIVLLNIGLHERKSLSNRYGWCLPPSGHLHTFDAGLRLPARDAGFAPALEAGFPPASAAAALEAGFALVSVAAALEAGFAVALDGGLAASLEAGLTAA